MDLSELTELSADPVDEIVVTEHSETLRLLDNSAALAAAELQDEPAGALVLNP